MTDARIPERYLMDRRIVRLTHAQRSSYFMATLWSVSNRTDGHIEQEDLDLIPTFDRSVVQVLVERGLWQPTEKGWLDIEFATVQTSRDDLEVLDKARAADRRKKNRQNAHKRGEHHLCTPETCDQVANSPSPGEFPGEDSRGGHRIGEDRQDRQGLGEAWHQGDVDQATGELLDPPPVSWPAAVPPEDPGYCEHGMTTGKRCRHCPGAVAEARAA